MAPLPRSSPPPFDPQQVRRAVVMFRLVAAAVVVTMLAVGLTAAVGIALRAAQAPEPPAPSLVGPVLATVGAFAAGVAALVLGSRAGGAAQTIPAMAGASLAGSALAWLVNAAAAGVTLRLIFAAGPGNARWIPQLLLVLVNGLGLYLAIPRVVHLRGFRNMPTLPRVHMG